MANVAGTYDTTVKSPMGDQKATLTVTDNGDGTFSGTQAGAMGTAELTDGKVDGNKLSWKMKISVPMPMELEGEATVDGDTITGGVKAGAFGTFPLSGTRTG